MKKAVIITGSGFEESEFIYPYYRLQEAGFSVDVVTSNDETVIGKYGVQAIPTLKVEGLDPDIFDLLVVPGGHEAPDRVRQVQEILDFTKLMDEYEKPIASICHGPWVLISAGIMNGRTVTSYRGCRDDLINAGAFFVEEPVVVDNNIVTAQHYRDNPVWMRETLMLFNL